MHFGHRHIPMSFQPQGKVAPLGTSDGPCPLSACGSEWVRQREQDDQCLFCIFSPALNTFWNLGCPLLTSLQVQDNSADSAVSLLSPPGLEQDSQQDQWWEDKLFHRGWRLFVYQSGSLAVSPALWSWLLDSAALLMVLAFLARASH